MLRPWWQRCILWLLIGLLVIWPSPRPAAAATSALLVSKNPVTDAKAILRNALPIDNAPIRDIQARLEDIRYQLRLKRWSAVQGDVKQARRILEKQTPTILASIDPDQQAAATQALASLQDELDAISAAAEIKDRYPAFVHQDAALDQVGKVEALMVHGFPFPVPSDYSHLPQLRGRATVELVTDKGTLTVVVDGYSAPVTAGNFLDLVQRGFYDGLTFDRAEESYVLQAGDPPGPADSYLDPATGEIRTVPLEILVRGDEIPLYGTTLEAAGRYLDQPVLPFAAYGTLAMARREDDPNSASSQFFFLLFEPELTPAGINLLDGRYAVFGYLVEGREVMEKLREGDTIRSAHVISGAENLIVPKGS
ncbi:MAG: peptidylprolyl isomerase [Gloeomargaritaceae cyanobacterium C42_A2020_066]|nr:peptidylprolyl isomerase [Gloeomargaritaceae cyanobacterium C42_A2020_066]